MKMTFKYLIRIRILHCVSLFLSICPTVHVSGADAVQQPVEDQKKSLYDYYKASWSGADFVPTPYDQAKDLEELFYRIFKNGMDSTIASQLKELGLNSILHKEKDRAYLLIHELKSEQKGNGFYIINLDQTVEHLLMMPHRRFDKYTGSIGFKCFSEGAFKAAAWNTVRRYKKDRAHDESQDMARQRISYLNAFSFAFARAFPEQNTIQIHGFSKKKHSDDGTFPSDIIVSSGHSTVSSLAVNYYNCIRSSFEYNTSLYPMDVRELGGEVNVTAQLLRVRGYFRFIHIEIAGTVRKALYTDDSLRKLLIECLTN